MFEFSGDLENEKVMVVTDIRQLSDAIDKLKEEVTDYKEKFDSIIEFANNNGIEVPPDLQQFVSYTDLL